MMKFENSVDFAAELDEKDELRSFRNKFHIPKVNGKDVYYYCGNSLGLQPKTVKNLVNEELDDWAEFGVEGHIKKRRPWVSYHEHFMQPLNMLCGAQEGEVVAMNQLTLNLHLLLVSFYKPTKERYKILCEAKAFPSDQYALQTQVAFHGFDPKDAIIEVSPRENELLIRDEDIIAAIEKHGSELAVVMIGGVNYYTGQVFDMKGIVAAAHKEGARAGFDLAHAIGNLELKLHDWGVDFATWCSYKYLNSGPGGVSGIFVHNRHHNAETFRFGGWWGHDKERRFLMEKHFSPIHGAEGWQLSNAPVLSMAAHMAALDIFNEAGIERLSKKRDLLTGYLEYIISEVNNDLGHVALDIITPKDLIKRGAQLSVVSKDQGKELFYNLLKKGVIADWREPDVIRLAPVPLYNTFKDVYETGRILVEELRK